MSTAAAAERALTDRMREFLERQLYLTLATQNGPDGSLHAVPVCDLLGGGRCYVATSAVTCKARNLTARPKATVTIDDRSSIEWVSATGRAELIRGPEPARSTLACTADG